VALVAPQSETKNPLPVGRYLTTIRPERRSDFNDWLTLYGPRGFVVVIARTPLDDLEHITFDVARADVVIWWPNLFGPAMNLTNAPRVVVPNDDRVQKSLEKPVEVVKEGIKAAETGLDILGQAAPLLIALGVLYFLSNPPKGIRHAMF